ncbi:hypothetical protein ONK29_25065, partial [Salmonella enterica subsp. enterica serovar Anatum]|nr:hypothetical protein [Salmonella enterica subsp. enterica serovar Anatum]
QYGVPEKPADLSSHSWLEYSVRPDNEFELIAPEGISTRLIPQRSEERRVLFRSQKSTLKSESAKPDRTIKIPGVSPWKLPRALSCSDPAAYRIPV